MQNHRTVGFYFIFKILIFIFLTYIWFGNLTLAIKNQNLKGFDPFDILSVETDATDK